MFQIGDRRWRIAAVGHGRFGGWVTLRFRGITDIGIPFHPFNDEFQSGE
jgi:hypothetical protein